jgi:hypothetical protein
MKREKKPGVDPYHAGAGEDRNLEQLPASDPEAVR